MTNRFFKKTVSVFVAVAMVLSLVTGVPFGTFETGIAGEYAPVIASGTCGADTNEGGDASLTWAVSYKADGRMKLVISGNGAMKDYESHGTPWDNYWVCINEVVLEDGITNIGTYAFQTFALLTTISIPDSVTSIGNFAFFECIYLTKVDIPDSVTSIGHGAFFKCESLVDIRIPSGVTFIGGSAPRER